MQTKDHVGESTGKAAEARGGNGGLKLSEGQLDAILSEARRSVEATQPTCGKGSPTLAIDRLAQAATNSGAGQPGGMTLSLDDLTQMLKKEQSDALRAPGTRGPRDRNRARQGARGGRLRPGLPGRDARLNVNLLANLARWVGFHKRILGTPLLRALVETYAMTGHLSPSVADLLVRVEAFSFLPDESDHHETSDDHLSIAVLSLHGIIYGAGSLPAEPQDPLAVARALKWSAREDAADEVGQAADSGQESTERDPAGSQPTLPRDYERALSALRKAFAGPSPDEGADGAPEREASPEDGMLETEASEAKAAPGEPSNPTDLTDDEWERIRPLVPVTKTGGRPGKYDKREIVNAILFHLKTGCPWRGLPSDLPPWKIAHHYYRTWTGEGVWGPISEALGLADGTETRSDHSAASSTG